MKMPLHYLVAAALLSFAQLSLGEERSPIYPFDVTTGKQKAKTEGPPNAAIFAKLKKSVSADAEFILDIEPEMVIVNVFPTDAKGTPTKDANTRTKIIMVQKGDRFSLDNTMDKKPIAPGTYGMNIVVSSKGTARVLIEVTANKPEEKKKTAPTDIQATPEAAVTAIFDRAKSGDLNDLKQLLPPENIADGDVRNLCTIGEQPKEKQDEFRKYFKDGKIVGKTIFKDTRAYVKFLFGNDGKKEEMMHLIQIDKRWYLEKF